MRKKLYLAYGSNLNIKQMSQRCPAAKPVGATVIKNYTLIFRGGRGNAVATIEPFKGRSVPCVLWEITPSDENALDRYEGFPVLYRKETMKVRFSKRTVEAMVYIMNDSRSLGSPSCYYYSVIAAGYNTAGFDISILKQAVRESEGEYNG